LASRAAVNAAAREALGAFWGQLEEHIRAVPALVQTEGALLRLGQRGVVQHDARGVDLGQRAGEIALTPSQHVSSLRSQNSMSSEGRAFVSGTSATRSAAAFVRSPLLAASKASW